VVLVCSPPRRIGFPLSAQSTRQKARRRESGEESAVILCIVHHLLSAVRRCRRSAALARRPEDSPPCSDFRIPLPRLRFGFRCGRMFSGLLHSAFCTLPSALCILHSAFPLPLVRAPAGAHRGWDPGGGFSVRAGTIAHQQGIVVLAGMGSVVRPRGSNDERVRDGWEPVKLQAGTRYTVLGTGYTVLGTPYAVLERQTGNRRRRVACDKTLSSRHTDHRFPPRNGPDTTNVYTTTYDVSPSLLDQPRRHRTGRFLLLGFQCSPVRH
jgi:hypothetical protein